MTPVPSSGELFIRAENDIVAARRTVRDAATQLGFGPTDVTRLVTAASELARNVFKYAGQGVMRWNCVQADSRVGLELQFVDEGPGIADINLAMEEGYTTGGGLGVGLPGARRLVDELAIQSAVGQGTTVVVKKWRRN